MASSDVKSLHALSPSPARNTCTITTSCASTSSSIGNMLNHLVNCQYKRQYICAHIDIYLRVHIIDA